MGKPYIGVNGVAKAIKKMYVGVNGVAKEVKKAYIGVAGVAKDFFTSYIMPFFTGSGSFFGYWNTTPNHFNVFDGATCADAIAHRATKIRVKGHITWKTTNGASYTSNVSDIYFSASPNGGAQVQNVLLHLSPTVMSCSPTETTIITFDTVFNIDYITALETYGLNVCGYASQSWAGVCQYTVYADLFTFE